MKSKTLKPILIASGIIVPLGILYYFADKAKMAEFSVMSEAEKIALLEYKLHVVGKLSVCCSYFMALIALILTANIAMIIFYKNDRTQLPIKKLLWFMMLWAVSFAGMIICHSCGANLAVIELSNLIH